MQATRRAMSMPTRLVIIAAALLGLIALGLIAGWAISTQQRADAEPPATSTAAGPPSARADGLPQQTTLGITELKVRDLEKVQRYYEDGVGLSVLSATDGNVLLGMAEKPILRLVQSTDPLPQISDAGLYHTAILFADAPTLAAALMKVAGAAPDSYQGAADHLVSRAFYFGDPEGNGVELYVDRPRSEWEWNDGLVKMGREPLDVNQFIQENLGSAAAGTATLGHMHLKVGDLDEARAFYEGTLGFDVVAKSEGALFYSAGGYHHHIATNVWNSLGAGKRTTEVGLGSVTIELPDTAAVDAVKDRVTNAGFSADKIDGGILVEDPWGNKIRLIVPTS